MSTMAEHAEADANKVITAREKLAKSANDFAKASGADNAIITNFTQSADGIAKLDFSVLDRGTNSLRQFSMEMGSVSQQAYVTEHSVSKSMQKMQAASSQVNKMSSLVKTLELSGVDIASGTAHTSVSRLVGLTNELSAAINSGNTALIDQLMQKSKIATSEVEKLYKKTEQLRNAIQDGTAFTIGNYVDDKKFSAYDQLSDAVHKYAAETRGATLSIGQFNEKQGTLNYTMTDGKGNIRHYTASINDLGKTINAQERGVTKLQGGWQHFYSTVSRSAKQMTMAFAGYNIFTQAIHTIRQGVTYIKDIDTAMTELKKVTDETATSYARFVETSANAASKVGATTSDFINASADFARLGYEMNEAGRMAEAAIVYKNVADGLDTVEAATESITSTMKAFGIESNDTMTIIDSFNEVGNNFAITSAGIGEALKRSASALAAGGNTMEESIGLITGANTVVQDPEVVGTALKTLSLRIRGVKTELEEAGLEADGMAETTAQLQAKLLALTGGKVDIMIDEDNFKSTTQILREMATVWEDMTDVQQAAALELIGGKRQANILASLITNFETAEEAIETASNSAGSALKENEVFLDSIEGKTQLLTNSMQNMWNNSLKSEGVKFFLDLANSIVNVIDKVGMLKFGITGVLGVLAASKNNSFANFLMFDNKMTTKTQNGKTKVNWDGGMLAGIGQAFKQVTPSKEGGLLSLLFSKDGRGTLKQYIAEVKNYGTAIQATAKAEQAAATSGGLLNKIRTLGTALTSASSAADIKKAATTTAVGAASTAASIGVQALNAALTMGISLLVSAAITGVITLIDNVAHRAENLKQEVKELTDAYSDAKKTYKDNLDTLTTPSDTKMYADLLEEFNALTKGVSKNGDNLSLTTDQYERYREVCDTICAINPSLAAGYDSNTEAIGNNASALENLIQTQQDAMRREAAEYVSDDNIKKYAKDAINDYEEATNDFAVAKGSLRETFENEIAESLFGSDGAGKDVYKDGEEIVKEFLKQSGMTEADINKVIEEYTLSNGNFNFSSWASDNMDYISEHAHNLSDGLKDAAGEYRDAAADLKVAQDGMIDELLEVPESVEGYADLKNADKSFIAEWIKNSDMFKIDEDVTAEEVLGMKSTISEIVEKFTGDLYTTTLDSGTVVTASDILDSMFEIDSSRVNWKKYQGQIDEYINLLWDAIGGKNNTFGFKDKNDLKISLGIEFDVDKESAMVKRYAKIKNVTEEEAEKYFDSLPAAEVQRLLEVDWNVVDKTNIDKIVASTISTAPPSHVFSTLSEDVDTYNEVLAQTADIVSDNTVVTQDYYDSLVDLIGSEETVAECFDAANPLMVKNVDALNELLEASRNNVSANIELAESNARLQYYDLVQQLDAVCGGTDKFTKSSSELAHSLLDQIDAVQQAIYKYHLLQVSLNGADGAFNKFTEAKDVDAINTTGDTMVEMMQTLYDAFYETGEVGTAAFEAAIDGLIPDSVLDGLNSKSDQLEAAFAYYKNKLLPSLTNDDGTISIDQGDVHKFLEKAIDAGAITKYKNGDYDISKTALNEGWDMKKVAKEMGKPLAYVEAMMHELDKSMFGDNLSMKFTKGFANFDTQVLEATESIEDLNRRKLDLLDEKRLTKDADKIKQIDEEINTLNKTLQDKEKKMLGLGESAALEYEKYAKNEKAIAGLTELQENLSETEKLTATLTKEQAEDLGVEWKEGKTIQQYLDDCLLTKNKLGEPTELTIQYALQGISDETEGLINKIKEQLGEEEFEVKVKPYLTENEDGTYSVDTSSKKSPFTRDDDGNVTVKKGNYTEEQLSVLQSIAENLNYTEDLQELNGSAVTAEAHLADISANVAGILGKLGGDPVQSDKGDSDSGSDSGDTSSTSDSEKTKSGLDFIKGNFDIKKATDDTKRLRQEEEALYKVWQKTQKTKEGTANFQRLGQKRSEVSASLAQSIDLLDSLTEEEKTVAIKAAVKYEKSDGESGDLSTLISELKEIEDNDVKMDVIATLIKSDSFDTLLSGLKDDEQEVLIEAIVDGEGDVDQLNEIIAELPEDVQPEVRALVDNAIENITEVDGKLYELDNATVIAEIKADISNVDQQIADLKTKLANAGDVDPVEVGLKEGASVEEVKTAIQNKLKTLEDQKVKLQVAYNVATENQEGAVNNLREIQGFNITNKKFEIKSNAQTNLTQLSNINKFTIDDKEYTITKNVVTVSKGGSDVNGTAHAKGTAWAGGTAFKGGNWGAPRTETALMGELGPEIVNKMAI